MVVFFCGFDFNEGIKNGKLLFICYWIFLGEGENVVVLMIWSEIVFNFWVFMNRNYGCIYILKIILKVRGELVNLYCDFGYWKF